MEVGEETTAEPSPQPRLVTCEQKDLPIRGARSPSGFWDRGAGFRYPT